MAHENDGKGDGMISTRKKKKASICISIMVIVTVA
jgi:hypothetical protein